MVKERVIIAWDQLKASNLHFFLPFHRVSGWTHFEIKNCSLCKVNKSLFGQRPLTIAYIIAFNDGSFLYIEILISVVCLSFSLSLFNSIMIFLECYWTEKHHSIMTCSYGRGYARISLIYAILLGNFIT